jgi:hypothetical protein
MIAKTTRLLYQLSQEKELFLRYAAQHRKQNTFGVVAVAVLLIAQITYITNAIFLTINTDGKIKPPTTSRC